MFVQLEKSKAPMFMCRLMIFLMEFLLNLIFKMRLEVDSA